MRRDIIGPSLYPSRFVLSTRSPLAWGEVTICDDCLTRGHYADAHPVDPCRACGGKVRGAVGRWVFLPRPWWAFWRPRRGFWQLRDEARAAE